MIKENPFNTNSKVIPKQLISRKLELEEIYNSLSLKLSNNEIFIISGIRGSGKTVAMTSVSDFYKNQDEWIVVDLNSEYDLLSQLASNIIDTLKLRKLFIKAEFNFSFQGFGISLKGDIPILNVSTLLKKIFEYLKKKNIKVLITIDEIVSNQYTRIFAHEFQSFLRENFNVYLLMTGLYENVASFTKEKSLTFLYRAPKIYLKELNLMSIANSYKKIFSLTLEKSVEFAKFTKGYAYGYQLLGDILFISKDYSLSQKNIEKFDEIIYERAYSIIISELTPKEKEILFVSLENNLNEFIINKLKISKSQLSNYKNVLNKKGIIEKDSNSILFKLPRFKECLEFYKAVNDI